MMQLGSNSPRQQAQDQPGSPRPPPPPRPSRQPTGPPVYSLFIADIHPSITEIDLLELFAKSGTVLSIHLVRDRITRAPLGYGYVNFERADEAERALKEHNYITLGDTGRPLRIMWSRRNSAGKEWPPAANVFFKSLAPKTTSSVLHWVCAHFGEVLACKVVVDEETGLSKCYGFVQFEEEEAARKAIATLNGSTIDDSKVFAGRFIPKQEREAAEGRGGGRPQRTYQTTLYVKNLTGQLDSREKLERLFGQCGTVVSAAVALDEATQQSKGFGFVTFSSSEEAERAISELNGRVMEEGGVDGKEVRLYVGLLQKKAEREARKRKLLEQRKQAKKLERQKEGVNLYVKNLDPGVDDQRLKTAFASFGTITSARVMTTEPRTEGTNVKGREGQTLIPQKNSEGGGGTRTMSRGFGFVCFSRPEEALKAKTELHSKAVEGLSALGKPLYVGLAQSRAQREAWKVRMRYGGGGGWAQAGAIHSKQHSSSEYPLSMPSMIEVFGHGQQQHQRIPLPYLAHGQAQLSVVLNVHPFVNPNLGPPPVHYQDGPSLVEQAVLPPGFHIDAQSGQIVYDGRRRLGVERRAIAGTYHVPGAPARPDL